MLCLLLSWNNVEVTLSARHLILPFVLGLTMSTGKPASLPDSQPSGNFNCITSLYFIYSSIIVCFEI